MPDDWLSALARVSRGGLPQDTELRPPRTFLDDVQRKFMQNLYDIPGLGPLLEPPTFAETPQEGVEAVRFSEDPITQIAAIFAPMLRRGAGEIAARPPVPVSRLRLLGAERGSSESVTSSPRLKPGASNIEDLEPRRLRLPTSPRSGLLSPLKRGVTPRNARKHAPWQRFSTVRNNFYAHPCGVQPREVVLERAAPHNACCTAVDTTYS